MCSIYVGAVLVSCLDILRTSGVPLLNGFNHYMKSNSVLAFGVLRIMKKFLQDILDRVIGLECIVIADRDGVPLIKVSDDKIPETALMPSFLSTFGLASLQGTKLGMGESFTSICMYGSYQVVQMDLEGLSLTFVGSTDCNTGHIMAVSNELSPILLELKTKTELDASQP